MYKITVCSTKKKITQQYILKCTNIWHNANNINLRTKHVRLLVKNSNWKKKSEINISIFFKNGSLESVFLILLEYIN